MRSFLDDIRLHLRSLPRHAELYAVAIVTLALGIAASSIIFSVLHAVLLTAPPFLEPEKLVIVRENFPRISDQISFTAEECSSIRA